MHRAIARNGYWRLGRVLFTGSTTDWHLAAVGCLACLFACGSQSTSEYSGEPLLELNGHISSLPEGTPTDAVPAVLFVNREAARAIFLDVRVTGSFPANFSIAGFTTPPEWALHPMLESAPEDFLEEFPDEPDIAVGNLVVATQDHPREIDYWRSSGRSISCGTGSSTCRVDARWCRSDADCYRETSECQGDQADALTDCKLVSREGDESIKRASDSVLGISELVNIIYTPDGVPAGSLTAYLLGVPQGIPSGYALFESSRSLMLFASASDCAERAAELALERYNEVHPGATISSRECPSSADGGKCPGGTEFEAKTLRAAMELGCEEIVFQHPISNLPEDGVAIELSKNSPLEKLW